MGELANRLRVRMLCLDIERLPGLAIAFDQRTDFIPYRKFRRLPMTLCFAASWYDRRDKPIFHAAWNDNHEKMVLAAWNLLDQADVLVTFNGKRFDVPILTGDFAKYGLPDPAPWKNVDLMVTARRLGYLSKSLDHTAQQLGVPGKQGHYDPDVAERAWEGHRPSQRELKAYNVGDIEATWAVYDRLRPRITNHPHVARSADVPVCHVCGSTDLTRNMRKDYRAAVLEYALYRCNGCGANVRAGHVRRVATTRGVKDQ